MNSRFQIERIAIHATGEAILLGLALLLAGCVTVPPQSTVAPTSILPKGPPPLPTKMAGLASIVPAPTGQVDFTIDPSPDPTVVSYNIYWGNSPGIYFQHIQTTNLASSISGLPQTLTYFAATSVADNGVESKFSKEIFTMPTSPEPGYSLSFKTWLFKATWPGPDGTLWSTPKLGTNAVWTLEQPITAGQEVIITNDAPSKFFKVSVP